MAVTPIDRPFEEARRGAVVAWLDGLIRHDGEVLDFRLLKQGAPFRGSRQPVLHHQKGIYKPAGSPAALSLKTSLRDRYGDRFDGRDTLVYRMERSGAQGEARLLDAAHIDPDAEHLGEPVTSNGLALCCIHHAAFDAQLVSIEPELQRIRLQPRLLSLRDGPMLRHGLQGLEGAQLERPRRSSDRPDPERLRRHWQRFLERAG
jgi:hypothetical protein